MLYIGSAKVDQCVISADQPPANKTARRGIQTHAVENTVIFKLHFGRKRYMSHIIWGTLDNLQTYIFCKLCLWIFFCNSSKIFRFKSTVWLISFCSAQQRTSRRVKLRWLNLISDWSTSLSGPRRISNVSFWNNFSDLRWKNDPFPNRRAFLSSGF